MSPYSSDHSFTHQNISMVTATVNDDDTLAEYILQVPYFIREEIREKTSISADFREGAIEYYIQYSPRATWAELVGELYYRECGEALAAARRFIKRTPGKCIYIIFQCVRACTCTGGTLNIPIIIVLFIDSFQRQLSIYQTSTLCWRESVRTGGILGFI